MNKFAALFTAIAVVSSVAAVAGPEKKKTVKVTEVWTCPIQGEAVKDKTAKGVMYKTSKGTFDVHFCCGGCPEAFAKLSAKDKETKLAEAVKKDAAAKKG